MSCWWLVPFVQGPNRMLPVVQYMERESQFDRGTGKEKGRRTTSSSVISLLKVCYKNTFWSIHSNTFFQAMLTCGVRCLFIFSNFNSWPVERLDKKNRFMKIITVTMWHKCKSEHKVDSAEMMTNKCRPSLITCNLKCQKNEFLPSSNCVVLWNIFSCSRVLWILVCKTVVAGRCGLVYGWLPLESGGLGLIPSTAISHKVHKPSARWDHWRSARLQRLSS